MMRFFNVLENTNSLTNFVYYTKFICIIPYHNPIAIKNGFSQFSSYTGDMIMVHLTGMGGMKITVFLE